MVMADGTDDRHWVIWEFLNKIKQPNLPLNLFIPADESKKTVFFNGPITQKSYLGAIEKIK